ncbi:RNA polymerase sigma-70 factor, ECF subfamily [Nocardioides exalbidus]|uniref:RNA polymerase sigma-70 factor, ECF subfamily n=1 Tax=Nocardioides exalbidus TaxID=402596 RepID=A0A1H4L048_9ACTN|nr:sigma-70 family RNA polymerase sigma factor [Nocardioides exalbidus]SEB64169.1 RNA polymerase sigma-70 factor, ECF subfamily [Nocardioides exalbidus]
MRLSRAATGDQEAFAELYDLMSSRVHGLVLRVLRDHHHAEEVTQEVFVEVWRTSASFDVVRGSAQGWILTMAHRRAVDRVRSHSSVRQRDTTWHREHDSATSHDSTAALAAAHLDALSVREALALLPAPQRRALELAYLDGHTYSTVAQMMQAPVGTTKTRIRTALHTLRAHMENPSLVTT